MKRKVRQSCNLRESQNHPQTGPNFQAPELLRALCLAISPALFSSSCKPVEAKLQFRTNTRLKEKHGGKVPGTDWANQGKFAFSFWASLYADDAATLRASRAALLAATNRIYDC